MNTQALNLKTLNQGAMALDDADLEAVTGGNWLSELGTAAAAAFGIGAAAVASAPIALHSISANVAVPGQESANLAG